MCDERKTSIGKWLRSSLIGHVVALQLFYSLPMFVVFTDLQYDNGAGTLTFYWLLRMFVVSSLGGIVFAVLFWFIVTSRLLKKYEKKL